MPSLGGGRPPARAHYDALTPLKAQPILSPLEGVTRTSSTASPLVPTPYPSVVKLLRLCEAAPGDVLVDLGSGDGTIPMLAAFVFGVRKAVGIEVDPAKIERSRENASAMRLGVDRAEFIQGDMFSLDLGKFDVVTVFQSQESIARLLWKLLDELGAGARVVSYLLPLGTMSPLKLVRPVKVDYPFYLYRAPLQYMSEEEAVELLHEIAGFAEGSEREWALVSASIKQ